jgi:hypothetical protein
VSEGGLLADSVDSVSLLQAGELRRDEMVSDK